MSWKKKLLKGLAIALFLARQRKLKNENLLLNGNKMLKGDLCVNVPKKWMLYECADVNGKTWQRKNLWS